MKNILKILAVIIALAFTVGIVTESAWAQDRSRSRSSKSKSKSRSSGKQSSRKSSSPAKKSSSRQSSSRRDQDKSKSRSREARPRQQPRREEPKREQPRRSESRRQAPRRETPRQEPRRSEPKRQQPDRSQPSRPSTPEPQRARPETRRDDRSRSNSTPDRSDSRERNDGTSSRSRYSSSPSRYWSGPDRQTNPVKPSDRNRSAQPRQVDPRTSGRTSSRTRDAGDTEFRGNREPAIRRDAPNRSTPSTVDRRVPVIRSTPAGGERYRNTRVVRTRQGVFDANNNPTARRDRESVGSISMDHANRGGGRDYRPESPARMKGQGHTRSGRDFSYAREEYIRSDFRLVDRSGRHPRIKRQFLYHNDYGFGRCPDRYNGRNYHFYITLVNNNYYFGLGYNTWNRRYYGDGWDTYFGWNAGTYIPASYSTYGVHYFEPNYAFSFTFNHGYESGYLEGYSRGVQDWNNWAPYHSYYDRVVGYEERLGYYWEYVDGYGQGYIQGYYAGYSGKPFGWENFGFGDFADYPVVYDFDYDYFAHQAGGYEYTDDYYDYYNYE